MSCTIVVGGQYGSEGKGKVVALYAATARRPFVVRCGGPNSGHTVQINKREIVLRQIPAGAGHRDAVLLLAAGCVVDEQLLVSEADELELSPQRVVVDPRAVLLTNEDRDNEQPSIDTIGSTASGTGAALVRRMLRRNSAGLAGSSERLSARVRVEPVAPLLHGHLDQGEDVIVEGTQGFGLSLLHGPDYPYVTARDTTASGFAAEAGLSPRDITAIVMVLRTFPIRVGGNSGPLKYETSWREVQALSSAPETRPEYTSVTKRLRRVGHFDIDLVKAACRYNRPTSLAVMGLDRLDYRNTGARRTAELAPETLDYLHSLERATGVSVDWVGTGFGSEEAFSLLNELNEARGE